MTNNLDEWMEDAIQDGGEVRAFLMRRVCWSCDRSGWAVFLIAPYCRLISDASSVFRYPGILRQLREYFATNNIPPDFGAVKERVSNAQNRSYLSQGCHSCDAIWGDFPIREEAQSWYVKFGGRLSNSINLLDFRFAFTVNLDRLFEP